MPPASRRLSTESLPAQPFFRTSEQRAGLARQRFFEEDVRPSGLVSEAVIQSWSRSRALGHSSHKPPALDPVGRSVLHAALARSHDLLDAARSELSQLEASLTGTQSRVLLIDAGGVIVHATPGECAPGQDVLNLASRVGVNLSESHIGTTAPGIVVQTGLPSAVLGCEHYYERFRQVRCAAAPIRGMDGRLVGVLDLSTESRGFGFDAASMVGLFATAIENRLLQAKSDRFLVLHFQATPSLLDTPMEALAGLTPSGEVAWLNATACSLLGCGRNPPQVCAEALLGVGLNRLLAMSAAPGAHLIKLPSGLGIWMRAEMRGRDSMASAHAVGWSSPTALEATLRSVPADASPLAGGEPAAADAGAGAPEPAAGAVARGEAMVSDGAAGQGTGGAGRQPAPAPASEPADRPGTHSLAEAQRTLVQQTLREQNGNVARTARLLGVSRGLVYRHRSRSGAG